MHCSTTLLRLLLVEYIESVALVGSCLSLGILATYVYVLAAACISVQKMFHHSQRGSQTPPRALSIALVPS